MEPDNPGVQPARLISLHAHVRPHEHTLADAVCTIGRAPTCTIVIQKHTISRVHARIDQSGPRYILSDAGSINGTYVNGHRLHESHLLKDADVIGLGSANVLLRFLDPDPTAVSISQLRYDAQRMTFYLGQQQLDLSAAQVRLMLHLYQHAGDLCSYESCARALWGPDYDPEQLSTIDRAVNRLRDRLRAVDPTNQLIRNRRGQGYLLDL